MTANADTIRRPRKGPFNELSGSRVARRRSAPAAWRRSARGRACRPVARRLSRSVTFPPGPLSTGRWVFPNPAGSERISAAAFPTNDRATGALTRPERRLVAPSWRTAFAAPWILDPHDLPVGAQVARKRAVARVRHHGVGRTCPEALCSGGVMLSPPSSLIRPQPPVSAPPDDFPHGYTPGLLPYGRVLAWHGDLPRFEHRSLPWCHRPYAGEPDRCTCPISSLPTLAFAHLPGARRSHPTVGLEHSHERSSWWV